MAEKELAHAYHDLDIAIYKNEGGFLKALCGHIKTTPWDEADAANENTCQDCLAIAMGRSIG